MSLRNKHDIYEFLESDIFIGNIRNSTVEDIIEYFDTRYNDKLLSCETLKSKKFYFSTVNAIKRIFDSVDYKKAEEIAIELMNLLHNKHCNNSVTDTTKWFYAAIIHMCFDCLKESTTDFFKTFSKFKCTDGETSKFCRFIIVAKIECYCRYECNSSRSFHKDVISYDGEPVSSCGEKYGDFLTELWVTWNNFERVMDGYLSCNNFLKNTDIYKSLYWLERSNNTGGTI